MQQIIWSPVSGLLGPKRCVGKGGISGGIFSTLTNQSGPAKAGEPLPKMVTCGALHNTGLYTLRHGPVLHTLHQAAVLKSTLHTSMTDLFTVLPD